MSSPYPPDSNRGYLSQVRYLRKFINKYWQEIVVTAKLLAGAEHLSLQLIRLYVKNQLLWNLLVAPLGLYINTKLMIDNCHLHFSSQGCHVDSGMVPPAPGRMGNATTMRLEDLRILRVLRSRRPAACKHSCLTRSSLAFFCHVKALFVERNDAYKVHCLLQNRRAPLLYAMFAM